MARLLAVFSVLAFAFCLASPQASDEATQTCHTITVSGSLTLQQAVEQILAQDRDINCTSVELPSGEHTITSQTLFTAELTGLQFVGVGENVCVSCNYSVATNYTWYFDHLESVVLQNIHFEDCPRPLRLDTIADVEISNCSFRYFTEAALDIYNSHHTVFTGTTLEHNRGTGIVLSSYRGNTGGVAFGYNTLPSHFTSPSLDISNSTFRNNSATAEAAFLTSSEAFFMQIFTGRGGAIAVFTNESRQDISVTISDCIFEKNHARSFGGGAYLLLGGFTTYHRVKVQRTRFISNIGQLGGGAAQVSFFNDGPQERPLVMTFVDCEFTNNTASAGGGVYVFPSTAGGQGNRFRVMNSSFTGNTGYTGTQDDYGAALAVSLFATFTERSNFPRHEVNDCTFTGNSGINGIISVGYAPMDFTGKNTFLWNMGTALRAVGTKIHLSGELHFVNNSGGEESALHMLSFAQAVLSRGLFMNFEGNTGRFGASLQTDTITTSIVYNQLANNPQCPFLYEEGGTVPEDWDEVSIRFHKNKAVLGSAVYMSRLDTCSWYSRKPPFFNNTYIVDWPIWEINDTNVNTGYSNETDNILLSFQTTVEELVVANNTIKVWPGFRFDIGMGGMDEFSHFTTASAEFSFHPFNDSNDIPLVKFVPEIVVVGTDPSTGLLTQGFRLYYGIANTSETVNFHDGPLGVVSVQVPFETQPVEPANFTLAAVLCPGGYVLQSLTSQTSILACVCNEEIPEVLLCEDDQQTVVIQRGKWAVYVPSAEEANLKFYSCPTGYCRCSHESSIGNTTCVYTYSHSDPDLQCTCERRGVLCGECVDGSKGVSALLNNCVSCSDASGLLILALIVADAVVFVALTLLDKPLPSWTYPFIFYLQLAPVVGLNFSDSFLKVGKFLFFVGSALGFYFPYDFCLYGDMSSQMAYFIRFLPLFVAIITCATVLCFRSWMVRQILKRKPLKHHGVWWVVLLLYSHVVYTSMTVLNCPSITDTDGTTSARWFVNGEVKCFTGGHIPLALLAIVVLLAAALLIPLTAVLSTGPWRQLPHFLKYFRVPLAIGYKKECQWWSALELGRRFFLILFIVALPQNDVVPVLVLAIYTTVYSYVQPYKRRATNIIETAVNLNFLLLLLLNATSYFHEDFFTFPSLSQSSSEDGCPGSISGIAVVSWILMPFYYLPLLTLCITAAVFGVLYLRAKMHWWWSPAADNSELEESVEDSSYRQATAVQTWHITLNTEGEEEEGFVTLNRQDTKSRRTKSARNKTFVMS